MKREANDIYEMLDTLALPVAAQRFAQLSESPELGSYTALQLLREVLEPQYIETLNKRFETNLRLSMQIAAYYGRFCGAKRPQCEAERPGFLLI